MRVMVRVRARVRGFLGARRITLDALEETRANPHLNLTHPDLNPKKTRNFDM